MPADYFVEEQAEIDTNRGSMTIAELNEWYDKSAIKSRVKKTCMQIQRLRCCYCKKFQDTTNNNIWDLEHVLSEKLYPQFFCETLNLAVACKRCNIAKGQKDVLGLHVERWPTQVPDAASDYTIPHPHLSVWEEHVRHTSFIIYEALTPQGDELKTICKLNELAEKGAGLSAGAIQTAKATQFFSLFAAVIPADLDKGAAVQIMDVGARHEEDLRVAQQLIKLETDLASATKKFTKRT